jgi:DNA-binding transcriptional MocR family regulator
MWTPSLSSGAEPLYRRMVDAMAADIEAGRLSAGEKLPPHRELAHRTGLAVGTITRAYEEAELRGLIIAHVGRGSFVAGSKQPAPLAGTRFDLSHNICPSWPAASRINAALGQLRRRGDLIDRLNYSPPLGLEADRRAGADWLGRIGGLENADWQRTACCLGAQQAMGLAVRALAAPGDAILCEELTYAGMIALGRDIGHPLIGVKMDREGLCPEALAKAARDSGARLLYVVPTLQNPTARIMSPARRAAIAEVARKHDLQVIEDDIYAHFARDLGFQPLANLIPERTIYVGGISKAVAPGLRSGFLTAPNDDVLDRIAKAIRATTNAAPGLTMGLATHWIESGIADEIVDEVVAEVKARTALAAGALHRWADLPASPASHHLWLPMAAMLAERTVAQAGRVGVDIMMPHMMMVHDEAETGIRISLGAVPDRAQLSQALKLLQEILSGASESRAVAGV